MGAPKRSRPRPLRYGPGRSRREENRGRVGRVSSGSYQDRADDGAVDCWHSLRLSAFVERRAQRRRSAVRGVRSRDVRAVRSRGVCAVSSRDGGPCWEGAAAGKQRRDVGGVGTRCAWFGARCAECGTRCAECGMWYTVCVVWYTVCVVHGVRSVVHDVCSLVHGVRSVVKYVRRRVQPGFEAA
eukprot:601971-Rhodomonas_salina.1